MKYFFTIFCISFYLYSGKSQDISLLNMKGYVQSTYLNPGLKMNKKVNLAIGGFNLGFGTDGPSVNEMTSKNSVGQRYIDISKSISQLNDQQNVFFANDIHTLDLGINIKSWSIMAGHAFKSYGNFQYTKSLVQLAAQGNAQFIDKTIQIGPKIDVNSYNELYLGLQKTLGNLSIGTKGKLIYGTANLYTEKSNMALTTSGEYYQLQFENDYLIRSSSLLQYHSIDSITTNYSGISFDNLFYNNMGVAFDLGASYQLGDKWTFSASVLDLGKINWDFFPKAYRSKGSFAFEGVDVLDYIKDSTISVQDTLLDLIKVSKAIENYSTSLNSKFILSASYQMSDKWMFNGMYLYQTSYRNSVLSLSAVRKISVFDLGFQYTISKNNFSNLGLYGKIKLGPVAIFSSFDNVIGIFKPFDSKYAAVRLGAALQF